MTDTVVILTGASRGLGRAMAFALAKPGTLLITLSRRTDAELQAHARAAGCTVQQHAVDLSSPRHVDEAARAICTGLPTDAQRYRLINNAGTVEPIGTAESSSNPAVVASAFNLNVTAPILLTANFLSATQGQADRRVLNISSGAGRNARAGWGVYCATKAALDMHTRVVKEEQGNNGARIVSLAPGVVDTDMQVAIRSSQPEDFPSVENFRDMHATGKLAAPDAVAARILAHLESAAFGTTEIDDIRNLSA